MCGPIYNLACAKIRSKRFETIELEFEKQIKINVSFSLSTRPAEFNMIKLQAVNYHMGSFK